MEARKLLKSDAGQYLVQHFSFFEKGFKKMEHSEHIVALLLFLFVLNNFLCLCCQMYFSSLQS